MIDEDRSARSAWKVAHSKALGPRIIERPPNGPGRPLRRAFVENSTAASVRECPFSAKRARGGPDSIVSWVFRIVRKVASRKALVELYKSLSIDEFRSTARAVRALQEMRRHEVTTTETVPSRRRRRSARWRREPRPTQLRPGGSRAKRGHAAYCNHVQRPTQLVPGALAQEERHAACCGGVHDAVPSSDGRRRHRRSDLSSQMVPEPPVSKADVLSTRPEAAVTGSLDPRRVEDAGDVAVGAEISWSNSVLFREDTLDSRLGSGSVDKQQNLGQSRREFRTSLEPLQLRTGGGAAYGAGLQEGRGRRKIGAEAGQRDQGQGWAEPERGRAGQGFRTSEEGRRGRSLPCGRGP
ncbi:hypothetical protein THAOC_24810 [Thalassiosira oceanica]|uniref:Uncharacterized protein n=1 Tax=Thalassiosira oceanica TaxID=159749 RepID=K0RQS2_THAOC|nr:hypothetical protein THAOC_24810 [Thalassiosira oceanica]|eukprot:EJK55460.1 hypothetical protein THAOC_24810 [Thalassiosira oceanica]